MFSSINFIRKPGVGPFLPVLAGELGITSKTVSRAPELTPIIFPRTLPAMPSREKLAEFVAWCQKHITGDEKGEAQIFLDRLFQAFGQPG